MNDRTCTHGHLHCVPCWDAAERRALAVARHYAAERYRVDPAAPVSTARGGPDGRLARAARAWLGAMQDARSTHPTTRREAVDSARRWAAEMAELVRRERK